MTDEARDTTDDDPKAADAKAPKTQEELASDEEDRAADRFLEQLHAARERRLTGLQPPGGIAERTALDHREEIAEMA